MVRRMKMAHGRAMAIGSTTAFALMGIAVMEAATQGQTPPGADVEMPSSVPAGEIPFFGEWLRSPHARRGSEAFTHWDQEGKVAVPCARCHSTPGFRDYVGADGSAADMLEGPAPTGTVITCLACHNDAARALDHVTFPSGMRIEDVGPSARCMTCHQGLASGIAVDQAVAGQDEDKPNPELVFINIHYRAAGATLMGALAHGAYQYPDKPYATRFRHPEPYDQCITCHQLHTARPAVQACTSCHDGVTDRASLRNIRKSPADHDGDGDMEEGIAREVADLHGRLLDAIKAYAAEVAGKPIAYELHSHPYFFLDNDGSGIAEESEARMPNRYDAWTPRLLKAAYNYQFVAKDPGAYAHNPAYTLQILHDSLADLGSKVKVDLAEAVRPDANRIMAAPRDGRP